MIRVTYFSTQNRISPFVALIGDWPTRAAMMQSANAGVCLGWRKAIPAEVELFESAPRHVALTWGTLRAMLKAHKSPDLEGFYPGILARVRKFRHTIKENVRIVERKKEKKAAQRLLGTEIARVNRARRKPASPQLSLFADA